MRWLAKLAAALPAPKRQRRNTPELDVTEEQGKRDRDADKHHEQDAELAHTRSLPFHHRDCDVRKMVLGISRP
jgi:hypothetical protein